jgi:hypothetical protein
VGEASIGGDAEFSVDRSIEAAHEAARAALLRENEVEMLLQEREETDH